MRKNHASEASSAKTLAKFIGRPARLVAQRHAPAGVGDAAARPLSAWQPLILSEASARLRKLYPMGMASRSSRNHSDTLRRGISRSVKSGRAERLSVAPPVYTVASLLTAEEAVAIRETAQRRSARWRAHHPRVCFQHDAYTGDARLRESWAFLSGTPGAGARGCLSQAASAAVEPALPLSTALMVHRGQEPLFDELSLRVQKLLGLHDTHAHAWQVLTYEAGRDGGYREHTDCRGDLFDEEERMATLLIYLSDDFDGGETAFPCAPSPLRPCHARAPTRLL